jgi:hypothetical protein
MASSWYRQVMGAEIEVGWMQAIEGVRQGRAGRGMWVRQGKVRGKARQGDEVTSRGVHEMEGNPG